MQTSAKGPMKGVRVLDLSQIVAGPLATQMLAEQGADVVKVEPVSGEIMRVGLRGGMPALYANNNRGKRCIAIDAQTDEGRQIILDLAYDIDVFVENFRPGVADRLGLGEQAIRDQSPNVIYVSITGFGPTGPYAKRACLDPIIQGITGMVDGQRSEDLPFPDLIRTLVADKSTAYAAAQSIAAALFARERGASGQKIELSMLEVALAWYWPDGMSDHTLAENQATHRRAADGYRLTDTADGQITYYLASTEQIRGMWRALERLDMLEDDRYNHNGISFNPENFAHVGITIAEEIARLPTAEILERLARESVPAGPILPRDAVADDPQVRHSGLIVEWDHPKIGRLRQTGPAVAFHGTPAEMRQHIEDIGESTIPLLQDLGRSDAEIERLRTNGIVFTEDS